jgi:hypothetical protein
MWGLFHLVLLGGFKGATHPLLLLSLKYAPEWQSKTVIVFRRS